MGAPEANTTLIYGVHIRESANDGSDFSNAASDYRVLFLGEDGLLHVKDSAGAVTDPFSGGSGIAGTIFDAKGDILVASAADTPARLAAGSDYQYLRARAAATNGLEWVAEAGRLIGLTAYDPGSAGTYTTTTTFADMDATNLQVTFTVPSTGNVLIRLTCQAFPTTTSGSLVWGLRESSSTVGTPCQVAGDHQPSAEVTTYSRPFRISGLTPGDSKTYKWGAKHSVNSWTNRWGGGADANGAAMMEVWAAP